MLIPVQSTELNEVQICQKLTAEILTVHVNSLSYAKLWLETGIYCSTTQEVKPVVYAQVGGAGLAIIDKAEAGPQFGAEGLSIALQPGRERTARSRLGSYYAKRADGGRSLFGPGEEKGAQLTDLQVTCRVSTWML